MGKSYTDPFTRANGAIGSIPGGPAYLAVNGTLATIASNAAQCSNSPSTNPITAVVSARRSNGNADVDASLLPKHVYGNALYARIVDAANWVRAKVYSYTTSYQYYDTEYEWFDNKWYDHWQNYYTEYQHQHAVYTDNSCSYSAWSSWSNCGFTPTACRTGPQAGNADVYDNHVGTNCGGAVTQYQVISLGQGSCGAGKATYQQQCRTRSVTFTPGFYTYSYYWDTSSTPASGDTNTGATRQGAASGVSEILNSNQTSTTAPAQGSSAPQTYSVYVYTASLYSGSTYWSYSRQSTGPTDSPSPSAGAQNSRQVGPYTGYNYYYGTVVLEKCVAGTITPIASYASNSATPQVIRVRAKGDQISVYYGGTLRFTATDSAHMKTATMIGFGGGDSPYNATTPNVDDFSYTQLSPWKIRNSANTAWIDIERPKVLVGGQWIDFDPTKF